MDTYGGMAETPVPSIFLEQHLCKTYKMPDIFLIILHALSHLILRTDTSITSLSLCFPGGTSGKEPACQCRRHKRHGFSPWVGKIPLEEEMATHSSILAWKVPWTEEPDRL